MPRRPRRAERERLPTLRERSIRREFLETTNMLLVLWNAQEFREEMVRRMEAMLKAHSRGRSASRARSAED